VSPYASTNKFIAAGQQRFKANPPAPPFYHEPTANTDQNKKELPFKLPIDTEQVFEYNVVSGWDKLG
jgi:hypothetical protein